MPGESKGIATEQEANPVGGMTKGIPTLQEENPVGGMLPGPASGGRGGSSRSGTSR